HGPLPVYAYLPGGLAGLGPAERPQHRVRDRGRAAKGGAEGLAVGLALLLERREPLAGLVPGLRVVAGAGLLEPRAPIRDGIADDRVRRRQPLAIDLTRRRPHVVEAALGLGDLVDHVAHVDDTVVVEMRPVVLEVEDVGAGPRLDGGGDARLRIVAVEC